MQSSCLADELLGLVPFLCELLLHITSWTDLQVVRSANHRSETGIFRAVQVFEYGVDEWLALCKHFKRLSDKYPDDWEAPATADLEDSSVRRLSVNCQYHVCA